MKNNSKTVLRIALGGTALTLLLLLGACSNEPPVTEGDAPIIKTTPKNLNPPAKALREKAGAGPSRAGGGGGGQGSGTVQPPEGN